VLRVELQQWPELLVYVPAQFRSVVVVVEQPLNGEILPGDGSPRIGDLVGNGERQPGLGHASWKAVDVVKRASDTSTAVSLLRKLRVDRMLDPRGQRRTRGVRPRHDDGACHVVVEPGENLPVPCSPLATPGCPKLRDQLPWLLPLQRWRWPRRKSNISLPKECSS